MLTTDGSRIDVLDHGYVRLVDVMGDDLAVVNSARVSFDKESRWPDEGGTMAPRDARLLGFLAREGHTSPFRHPVLSFEVYAPMMVMRQWGKYRIGSAWSFADSDDPLETWNEASRRYVTEEPVCYVPIDWRAAPEHRKQGSGPALADDAGCTGRLREVVERGLAEYARAIELGVCPEQARLFLPAYALYVRARWTVSLQGVLHFLGQRLGSDAQEEIRRYAEAVRDLTQPRFPASLAAWGIE